MSTITTRSGKGSPLTNNEVDANFTNLNTDKLESADLTGYAELTGATFTGEVEATGFNGDLTGAILFKGQAGEGLAKGDPVYISGISGNKTVVSKADANDANKMPCFGIVDATVSANADCSVVTFGTLQGLDTSSFSEGDELFVSDTGTLTTTAPTGESSQLQKIGKVTRSHASTGSIKVMGAGRTNAVPNLNDGKFFLGNGSNQAVSTDFASSVTAAGALMDSELTDIASVKALNQGVATTDSPTFSNLTLTGTDSVKVPSGTTGQRNGSPANGMFRYNSTTAEFEGYQDDAWGSIGGGSADITLNQFTGDGSDTTFTLSGLAAENNTFVYIDGVYQSKSNYSVSTANPAVLTFSTAPPNTTAIEVMVAAISVSDIGTPSDNTVTTAKIVDGAVTPVKIASGDFYFDTNTLFIDATNNRVGIGTASPSQALTVNGTDARIYLTGANTDIDMDNSANGQLSLDGNAYGFGIALNASGAQLYTNSVSRDLIFGVNETEVMRVTDSNVGIGTASPASNLHINSADTSAGLQITNSATGSAVSDGFHITVGSGGFTSLSVKENTGMSFLTGGTERARFNNTGIFLIGRTLTSATAEDDGLILNPNGLITTAKNGTGTTTHINFVNNAAVTATVVGTIKTSGSATSYNTSSDYRLKTDAQPMTGATDRLKALNPVNFEWISDGTRVDGFIAHEVADVVPEAISGDKDAVDEDGNPDYQGIDQSKLVPLLVATIQELEARITQLEG